MPLSQLKQLLAANGFGTKTTKLSPGFYGTCYLDSTKASVYKLEGFGYSVGLVDSPQLKALVELVERTSAIADSEINELKVVSHGLGWDKRLDVEFPSLESLKTGLSLVKTQELITGQPALIPAQLVYLYQRTRAKEPKLGLTSSVGSGAHFKRNLAIKRAICELVEWDSFITHFLVKGPIKRLHLSHSTSLVSRSCEVAVFEITNDLQIPSFLALLTNQETGALSFGLRAGFQVRQVIDEAILEAEASYHWLMIKSDHSSHEVKLSNALKRSFYQSGAALRLFRRYLDTSPNYLLPQFSKVTAEQELNQLLECLKQKHNYTYLFEYEGKYLRLLGLSAVKVVIPHLRPIDTRSRKSIDERITRLGEVANYFGTKTIKVEQPVIPLF